LASEITAAVFEKLNFKHWSVYVLVWLSWGFKIYHLSGWGI
jgi:hypothetical protein